MDNNLYNDLRLSHCSLDKKQIKEFAYNIKDEVIADYVKNHQKEYKAYQDDEYIKNIIKLSLYSTTNVKEFNIEKRIQLLETAKKISNK